METCCKILHYLDNNHYLGNMKEVCEKYLEDLNGKNLRKFPPLRFTMEVDIMELIDSYPDLGCYLLNEPIIWQNMCSDIFFACLQSQNDDPVVTETVKPTQLAVNLRFTSLPKALLQHNPRSYSGLILLHGLLISMSIPSSYVYHSVWSCPEQCEGTEVVLQYIPKVPPKCYVCKSILFENSALRRCGEQVTATFTMNNDCLPQTFQIVDDLMTKLRLGANYNIFMVTMKDKAVVCSLEEVLHLPAPITMPIPEEIEKLHKGCKGIPWQFIYCLASSLGFRICPLSCFMHLKVNLLLSLASVKAVQIQPEASIIHVLTAGFDTGYVGALMQEAAKLADRHLCVGTSNTTMTPSLALIGCSEGVCVMPLPLYTYNEKMVHSILASIETGDVSTDTIKTKLTCAVWAQGMDFKKINLVNVSSIFGTVCRGDYGEFNDELVDFLLENAIEPSQTSKEEVETLGEVALYLNLVAGIRVSLDDPTEKLLRDFFLRARRERPRGFTFVSMKALVATCLTSARLCRRTLANIDDAIFAIWLHVAGGPEPRAAPEEYLQTPTDVKKLEKIIFNFKTWLADFTGSHVSF